MEIHIVTQGETVYSIAQLYQISPERLSYDNQLSGQNGLVIGQSLLILIPDITHIVIRGDTLFSISQIYGTTIKQLLRNNPFLLNQEYLPAGEIITITYEDRPTDILRVTGYAYPFIAPYILHETLLYIDELLIFSYGFTPKGELIPPTLSDIPLIEEARAFGVSPILVLTPFTESSTFNNQLVTIVCEDLEVQETLIQNLLKTVKKMDYDGVDVDFEYILAKDRDGYVAFLGRLREVMSQNGFQVSAALAPKTSAAQTGLLYEGLDYKRIGEQVDYVFLMTYEWGYTYGPPMAVAPINKVRQVLSYAVTEIPPAQIIMGIPNYAYDWPLPYERGTTAAKTIGNVEAVHLASFYGARIQWDETAQSPYFNYVTQGITHEVWFEDVRSIQVKLQTAKEYGFLGIGYWNLMRAFRANWLLLQTMLQLDS